MRRSPRRRWLILTASSWPMFLLVMNGRTTSRRSTSMPQTLRDGCYLSILAYQSLREEKIRRTAARETPPWPKGYFRCSTSDTHTKCSTSSSSESSGRSLALLSFLHTSTRLTTTTASTPPSSSPELSLDASLLERAMQIRLQAAFQTGELTFSRFQETSL